jgi:hypothetical protein
MGLDLVTLQEYKSYMSIVNPTNDTRISVLITSISQLVKNYCRRTFVDYVDDPKVDIFKGGKNFDPSEYPIISVGSVEYSPDFGKTYTTLTEFTDYIIDNEAEQVVFINAPYNSTPYSDYSNSLHGSFRFLPANSYNYALPRPNAFRITFNAGYTEVPGDLKLAVFDLITYYIRNEGIVHSSRAPGSTTVQTEYININLMPGHIRRVLDLYAANYV